MWSSSRFALRSRRRHRLPASLGLIFQIRIILSTFQEWRASDGDECSSHLLGSGRRLHRAVRGCDPCGRAADYNAAFGGGLNPSLETPQGQLASSTTAILATSMTPSCSTPTKSTRHLPRPHAGCNWEDLFSRTKSVGADGRPGSLHRFSRCYDPGRRARNRAGRHIYTCTQQGTIPLAATSRCHLSVMWWADRVSGRNAECDLSGDSGLGHHQQSIGWCCRQRC